MRTKINPTRPYLVLEEDPPEGRGRDGELLVSLTVRDLISAWNEIRLLQSPWEVRTVPVWDALLPEQRTQIIKAVRNMDVALWSMFADFARQYQDTEFAKCARCGEPLKY